MPPAKFIPSPALLPARRHPPLGANSAYTGRSTSSKRPDRPSGQGASLAPAICNSTLYSIPESVSLSKGEAKRVLLALGLLTPHPLLLLDEPFDGLDFRQTRDVMALLRTIPATGRTLFVSIHQLKRCGPSLRSPGPPQPGPCGRSRNTGRTAHPSQPDRRRPGRRSSLPSRSAGSACNKRVLGFSKRGPPACRVVGAHARWPTPEARRGSVTGLLFTKEFRQLVASRALWLLLLIIGPPVGHGFITAVDTYAEASGIAGGPAALAQGSARSTASWSPPSEPTTSPSRSSSPSSPSAWSPPRRASGAWKLMLQSPASVRTMLAAKGCSLLAGWTIAWLPGLLALVLWKLYGGALYAPEVAQPPASVTCSASCSRSGIAVAAAAIANSAASAAIVTLGFTVGTWVLRVLVAGAAAGSRNSHPIRPKPPCASSNSDTSASTPPRSPPARARRIYFAAIWLREGHAIRTPSSRSTAAFAAFTVAIYAASLPRPALDLSENRRNSFSAADETALRPIRDPCVSPSTWLPKTRASSIWTATSSRNSTASFPSSTSTMPHAPAPACSKPPAIITAKSGTRSPAANTCHAPPPNASCWRISISWPKSRLPPARSPIPPAIRWPPALPAPLGSFTWPGHLRWHSRHG